MTRAGQARAAQQALSGDDRCSEQTEAPAAHSIAAGTTRSHLAPESLQEDELTDLFILFIYLWTGPAAAWQGHC
jgi:hypothetical protein